MLDKAPKLLDKDRKLLDEVKNRFENEICYFFHCIGIQWKAHAVTTRSIFFALSELVTD